MIKNLFIVAGSLWLFASLLAGPMNEKKQSFVEGSLDPGSTAGKTNLQRRETGSEEEENSSSAVQRSDLLVLSKAIDPTIASPDTDKPKSRFSMGGASRRESIASNQFFTPYGSPSEDFLEYLDAAQDLSSQRAEEMSEEKISEEVIAEKKDEADSLRSKNKITFSREKITLPLLLVKKASPTLCILPTQGSLKAGPELQQELTKKTQVYLLQELQKEEGGKTFCLDSTSIDFALIKLTSQQFWNQEKEILAAPCQRREEGSSEPVLLSFPSTFLPEALEQQTNPLLQENPSPENGPAFFLTVTRNTSHQVDQDQVKKWIVTKTSVLSYDLSINRVFDRAQVISKYNFPYIIQCRSYETEYNITSRVPQQQPPPRSCLIQ